MSASARVFVAVGPDWGRHPCSLAHVLGVVAREEPVIWINSIAQRAPTLSRRDVKRAAHKVVAALRQRGSRHEGGPFVVHPRAVPYHQFATVRSVNGWLMARQLRPILARYPDHRLVLVAANPAAVALANSLRPDLTLYFCMDDYARMHDSDSRLIEVCEALMLARADATIVTSQTLVERKSYRGRVPFYLPQGVDVEHFQAPRPVPDAYARIPRPVIGFQGIIGPRVDIELLEKIARRFPSASVMLVGKEEGDLGALTRYANVYRVGEVPYADLPAVVQVFDVGLIAYRQDGHTPSVNPLKLLEYLALGQEVVSVDLPELVRHGDYVHRAPDHERYLEVLASVLARYPFADEERKRRREYARRQSWADRARRFRNLCDALMSQRFPLSPGHSGALSKPWRMQP